MSKQISRFGVIVPDLANAISFYETLGFNKDRELEIPMMKVAFMAIVTINAWNRIAITTRMMPGS